MMWSTKSIPVVPIEPRGGSEHSSEMGKGCSKNTLSFQTAQQQQQLLNQAQHLQQQAQAQLKQAQREAEQLYYQAKQDIERWEKEASERGYQEGFEEGTQQGFDQGFEEGRLKGVDAYQAEIEQVKTTWLSVNQQITQELEAIGPQLVELMVQAVEKLTFQEFEAKPELLGACLQEMVSSLGKRQRCLIQVAPSQVETVEEYLPTLQELTPEARIQVLPNAQLTPSDCLLETELEQVDLTLDTQLNTLKDVWMQAVKR